MKLDSVMSLNERDSFTDAVLTPLIILKAKKNDQGNIINFIIESANDAAVIALNKKRNTLIGSDFFNNRPDIDNNTLFKKFCYVTENNLPFYRKNFKEYPFNKLKYNIRIKASSYKDKIILNWFDSSSQDKLAIFSNNNDKLRKTINDNKVELNELEELKEFYKILGNTIPYGGWMSDSLGKLLYISDSFLKEFNTTEEEALIKGWINYLPENEIKKVKKEWEKALSNKDILNTEFQILSSDKIQHSVLSTAHPLLDKKGDIKYWVGIHLKNDEHKEMENKLTDMVKRYKQSNEELQQFAYIASHDLQEPLRMVTSFTQLLERRYRDKLDEDGKEFINFAVDGAKRMKGLIDGLLSYSRVSTRSKEAVKIDVQKLIEDLIRDLGFIIKENNAKIFYKDLPIIKADKNQIYQLFQNLIMNGLKYRTEENPVIEISAKKEDSKWLFAVKDNGIGIDEKYFDRIFVVFQRLHSRDKYEGTGIGLAVCKRIVERTGGKIWVESKLNKGASFYFTIPEGHNHVK